MDVTLAENRLYGKNLVGGVSYYSSTNVVRSFAEIGRKIVGNRFRVASKTQVSHIWKSVTLF